MADVKLTPHGEKVVAYLHKEREANIERNGGKYVKEPWYRPYLGRNFTLPKSAYEYANRY